MDTKATLQDELVKNFVKGQEHGPLPAGVRNIRTILYYDPQTEIPRSTENTPRGELQTIAARLLMK
eukprot:3371671-Amphidinium_carterae.1